MKRLKRRLIKSIFYFPMLMLSICSSYCYGNEETMYKEITVDEESLARGKTVFIDYCKTCHGLRYYRDSEYKTGMEADTDPETAAEIFGMVPPDLSLIAKARGKGKEGALYIYQMLTTYYEDEKGDVKNKAFAEKSGGSGTIAMPPPIDKDDGLEEKAADVSAFLLTVSEPEAKKRRRIGLFVIPYMGVLTALLFTLNRRVWKSIK